MYGNQLGLGVYPKVLVCLHNEESGGLMCEKLATVMVDISCRPPAYLPINLIVKASLIHTGLHSAQHKHTEREAYIHRTHSRQPSFPSKHIYQISLLTTTAFLWLGTTCVPVENVCRPS